VVREIPKALIYAKWVQQPLKALASPATQQRKSRG